MAHGLVVASVLAIFIVRVKPPHPSVEIDVIETPKVAPQPVTLAKAKPEPELKSRKVFGVSRKALTSETGPAIKQGNTVAKAFDEEKLKPSDADSLPIPTEDYLVTAMPQLEHEVFVPYPPNPRKRGVEGSVVMDLLIDAEGKVRKVDLVDGPDPELSAAAVSAAVGFKFKPAFIQYKPVSVRIRYSYRFVIRG